MGTDGTQDRAEDPRLGHPYFAGGLEEMLASWAWHLRRPEAPAPAARPADDGTSRRARTLGAAPEMGELIVPTLDLPGDLPVWGRELLVCFLDMLVQDAVARIWDAGGRAAVTRHLARYDLSPEALEAAVADDMFFLGMVASEVMDEVADAGDRIRAIATIPGGGPLSG